MVIVPEGLLAIRYCRKCGYALRGLTTPRCPECGREFDPANPRTTRKRPPLRRWVRYAIQTMIVLLAFVMLLGAAWGWLYWDWRLEQQAVTELEPRGFSTVPMLPHWLDKTDHSNARWLQEHLGSSAGTVLDRKIDLLIEGSRPNFASLEYFRRVEYLSLYGTNISDLSPLAGLRDVVHLQIAGGTVTDLSKLAGMTKLRFLSVTRISTLNDCSASSNLTHLEELDFTGTSISDLAPLSGLVELKHLILTDTKVTDIRPLATLKELEGLSVNDGTPVGDLKPLYGLKSLKYVRVDKDFPEDQLAALKRALPGCEIDAR